MLVFFKLAVLYNSLLLNHYVLVALFQLYLLLIDLQNSLSNCILR